MARSVVAASAGSSPGWRRASLFVEQDDDVSAIGQTGLPCIMGTVMTGPAAGNALFFDDAATMEVELLAEGMVLTGASDDALLRGANLCLAGDARSDEHTSELQSLMRISYAVSGLNTTTVLNMMLSNKQS